MHALLTAGSIPILNAVPRIQQVTRGYVLAQGAQLNGMISRFADGLALLQTVWPEAFSSIQRHLKGIIALVPRSYACSHSPFHMNGVVLLTMDDPAKIADLLVHEVAHIRLNFLRQQDPLIEQDIGGKTYFSPWRQDRRPLIGVILGVHAFLNVCHYYRRLAAMPVYRCGAEAIYERQRSNVLAGWAEAQPHLHATQAAEAFFTELEREVMAL
jgi:HEXXH motif-containing protein